MGGFTAKTAGIATQIFPLEKQNNRRDIQKARFPNVL
jgi:hypothetical protein